jgi:hypothetical protein
LTVISPKLFPSLANPSASSVRTDPRASDSGTCPRGRGSRELTLHGTDVAIPRRQEDLRGQLIFGPGVVEYEQILREALRPRGGSRGGGGHGHGDGSPLRLGFGGEGRNGKRAGSRVTAGRGGGRWTVLLRFGVRATVNVGPSSSRIIFCWFRSYRSISSSRIEHVRL